MLLQWSYTIHRLGVLDVVVSKLSGAGVEGMAFAIPASVASRFMQRVKHGAP